MSDAPHPTRLFLRVFFGKAAMLGPGKAQLLAGIRDTGSIAAAGRQMGMSYKRAWMLVEEMNAAFRAPVVSVVRGGPRGGGAELTETGAEILARFQRIETAATIAAAPEIDALCALLSDQAKTDMSDGK